MNSAKTEFILFGSRGQLQKCTTDSINVDGVEIRQDGCIRYLGALLDGQLKMSQHISAKCRTAMTNLFQNKTNTTYDDNRSLPNSCIWISVVSFGLFQCNSS